MTTSIYGTDHKAGISRALTGLFAFAGGAAVGNVYWAQPLLGDMAEALSVSSGTAGLLVTLTQLGYALGVFLVVPLGDTVNRKRMIPIIMFLCTLSLLGCALAPNFAVLLTTLALVGFTNVAGQLLMPLAGDLATDDQRGRVVGTVASGLLTGILLSRLASGIVADIFGWRMVYFAAAAMMLVLTAVMAWAIPVLAPRDRIAYGKLLRSVVLAVVQHRPVRIVAVLGAALMCVFTAFWTGLTFHLSAAPFSFTTTQIGLVSLLGVLGIVGAQFTGRVYDRGQSVAAIGMGLALTLVAVAVSGFGAASIIAVLVAVALLSVGVQSVLVLLQTMMVSMDPAARSRLNTALIVGNFIGGALGSTLAAIVWQFGRWPAVMGGTALIVAFGLTVWFMHKKRSLSDTAMSSVAPAADIAPQNEPG
ncbi:MFS transporter [Arthrobacter sp. AK01]|uniref:MFS transporter n=1 Tax=Arthrobacter sp. AK01 TaxID=2894084 RepID=UPI001E2F3C31|nr:MFS transporter [Arthrobacter sp. AK01]MCD4850619.1 MFS transporter [Arthrobacter sp. AK01]